MKETILNLMRNLGDDDDAVVRQVLAGHGKAIARLYERHHLTVRRRLLGRGLGANDLEDLVQQVFLQAFCRLSQFRHECQFSGWLLGIAHHALLDWLRRRHRSPLDCVNPGDLYLCEPTELTPEERVANRELALQVARKLSGLTGKKRSAFLLYTLEGWTFAEIALKVGSHPPAVRQRVRHAKNELRASFKVRSCDAVDIK